MNVRKIYFLLFFVFMGLPFFCQAQLSKTLDVTTPGTLSQLIGADKTTTTSLTLTGTINDADFQTIKGMSVLRFLDIQNVNLQNGTMPNSALFGCKGQVILPSTLKIIPAFAFQSFNGSVTLPPVLETIARAAFYNASVDKLDFSNCPNLNEIGESAFRYAKINSGILNFENNLNLTAMTNAFLDYTGHVTLPKNLKIITSYTFQSFNGSFTLPPVLETIARAAFYNASVDKLDFSNCPNLNEIGESAFRYAKINSGILNFENNLNLTYMTNAFTGYTGHVTLPKNLKIIPSYAFNAFTGTVTLPPALEKIENYAFVNSIIKEIEFPSSLQYIDTNGFYNSTALEKITSNNPVPPGLGNTVFYKVNPQTTQLIVPAGAECLYGQTTQWKDFLPGVDLTTCTPKEPEPEPEPIPQDPYTIDLSTARNDDGTTMPIGAIEPNWYYSTLDGQWLNAEVKGTRTNWSIPYIGDKNDNNWITWNTVYPGGRHFFKSRTFEIKTDGKLFYRALAYVKHLSYLVKINNDGTETETLIAQTIYHDWSANWLGYLNSWNPELENYPVAPGKYYLKVDASSEGSSAYSVSMAACAYIKTKAEKDDTLAPNSYIFDINEAKANNYGGIYIPVQKAYDMWGKNKYFSSTSISGTPSASIYWEDVSGLIQSAQIVGSGETAKIQVMVNKLRGKGNAVIAFHSGPNGNSSDPVYWSWHVWVTDDPAQGVEYGHSGYPERDIDGNEFVPKFMDRNLGATSNNFLGNDWNKSGGLYYQWGRKDPIPPLVYKDQTRYNVAGTVGRFDSDSYYGGQGVVSRQFTDIADNIKYSVQHPFLLINAPGNEHWFSDKGMASTETDMAFDLWGDTSEGKVGGVIGDQNSTYKLKSPFDPCPDGWRVPSFRARTSTASVFSPWGGQSGQEPGEFNGLLIKPNDNVNTLEQGRYANVKFYPALGVDFVTPFSSNVSLLGPYSLSGRIWKNTGSGNMEAQDQFSETLIWSATSGNNYARFFQLQSTAEYSIRYNNPPEKFQIGSHMGGASTSLGHGVRCIQDPNRGKLKDYSTQYITQAPELNYTNGLDNPNSYIVKNNQTASASTPITVKIPVSKAYSVYNQYLTDHKWPEGTQQFASVIWSTITTVAEPENNNKGMINKIAMEGSGENANIAVTLTPGVTGNAVVALHIGNSGSAQDPVYWSWHLWIPNGDPEQNTVTYTTEDVISTGSHIVNLTNTGLPPLTTTFMNRDLGAEYAFPQELINDPSLVNNYGSIIKRTGGLHYQWGRKDPLPVFFWVGYSNVNQRIIAVAQTNNSNGAVTYPTILYRDDNYTSRYGYVKDYPYVADSDPLKVNSTDKDYINTQKVLTYSVQNPLTFMANKSGSGDWLTDKRFVATDRWGHADKKSVFDPCPAGWRVPDHSFAYGAWNDKTAKGTSPWYNGRVMDSDGTLGIVQHGVTNNNGYKDIATYYKGTKLNSDTNTIAAWFFTNPLYPIGAYPINLVRGADANVSGAQSTFGSRITGLWSASMGMNGRGLSTIFGSRDINMPTMNVGFGDYPSEVGLSVRCAKDEPRYTGAAPKPNSLSRMVSSVVPVVSEPVISESNIQVSPNPNSGIFKVILKEIPEGAVQVIDMSGNIVLTQMFKGDTQWEVNIQGKPAGVYFVRVQSGKQTVTKKIIKN